MNSPSRSVLESQINPCKANPSGRAHAKVAPGQRFQIEWSVGHSDPLSPHYFIYIANKDFGQLKKHANFGVILLCWDWFWSFFLLFFFYFYFKNYCSCWMIILIMLLLIKRNNQIQFIKNIIVKWEIMHWNKYLFIIFKFF